MRGGGWPSLLLSEMAKSFVRSSVRPPDASFISRTREATKFEKEYIGGSGGADGGAPGGPTTVVVSIILEIQGDATQLEGAGFSIAGTKEVLSSIASDVNVDGGQCLNAVEVFWTPGDKEEVLTKQDLIMDFPELIDL